ncbi:flavin reductase (DIM6/NTAB) family NADH-FMN oxidoreductase RutF [Nocardia transvalensis]|uniref:Flavin reductase (DIM6/NTAB) family NADH-FMN oxidoreductase RutF n=1 Tax=Nocardia transvalensis TaxID=37333 RepID=A0A7W9P9X4_9NOCA|nr:flavin reductase family protein [Nocardia transvalensis]MBB5912206.1 flavin reductase (DIM6/NTAB) family NADH-FMN oxidoreductase RutF [Nocardia transvalensis]
MTGVSTERAPSEERCLQLYRKLAASVAVISVQGADGPVGMTASSVTSLSLRPPLLLACLAVGSGTLAAIERSGSFAVTLLTEDQRAIAEDFASRSGSRFAGAGFRHVLGVPVLSESLAWAACLLVDARRYGDHVVVVGEVTALETDSGRPLLWHSQTFALLRT